MLQRLNISGNSPYEPVVGYSRAVRVGNVIHVAGTTATDEHGHLLGIGDPYAQAVQALRNIAQALLRAGASLEDVVRTRTYVTDITRWKELWKAHGEVFGAIRPAATMLQVSGLVDPTMLVEIEADAIVE